MSVFTVKETTQDRVKAIFQQENRRMTGEEVVQIYEERYGRTSTSDVVRTAISALTKKGYLREAGTIEIEKNIDGKIEKWNVKTWELNFGPLPVQTKTSKPTLKGLQDQVTILEAKNKTLEETNLKLLGMIEALREGKGL